MRPPPDRSWVDWGKDQIEFDYGLDSPVLTMLLILGIVLGMGMVCTGFVGVLMWLTCP